MDTRPYPGLGIARVMVCGNPAFTTEMRALLVLRGFEASRRGVQGSMVFEKYW